MSKIYKYTLQVGSNHVFMPPDPRWLHAGEQGGQVVCWAIVSDDVGQAWRRIFVVGTGRTVDADITRHHIGTVQMESGLVWRVFDGGLE